MIAINKNFAFVVDANYCAYQLASILGSLVIPGSRTGLIVIVCRFMGLCMCVAENDDNKFH